MANSDNKAFDMMTAVADKTAVELFPFEGEKITASDLAITHPFFGKFIGGAKAGLKNIKKAQQIHQNWINYLQKGGKDTGSGYGTTEKALSHHIKLVKDKDIAINALEGKGNYIEAKNIINKWKDTHVAVNDWLKVADKESDFFKNWRGGNKEWQDKWIKNYDQALEDLEKIYK